MQEMVTGRQREQREAAVGTVKGGWRVWLAEDVEDRPKLQLVTGGGTFSLQDYLTADEADELAGLLRWAARRVRERTGQAQPPAVKPERDTLHECLKRETLAALAKGPQSILGVAERIGIPYGVPGAIVDLIADGLVRGVDPDGPSGMVTYELVGAQPWAA